MVSDHSPSICTEGSLDSQKVMTMSATPSRTIRTCKDTQYCQSLFEACRSYFALVFLSASEISLLIFAFGRL